MRNFILRRVPAVLPHRLLLPSAATTYKNSSYDSQTPAMTENSGFEGCCFRCGLCGGQRPLDELTDLDCSDSICTSCCAEHLGPQLKPAPPPPLPPAAAREFRLGQIVQYRQAGGLLVPAEVVQVDRSIQPHGYGIKLPGSADVRFTEADRLLPHSLADSLPGFPPVRCPGRCGAPLGRSQLARALGPEPLQQLDDALTYAWLEGTGAIRCPACEALIEVVHEPAAGSDSGSSDATRIRCALCRATFCSACRVAPYHDSLSCREAAAPCCHMCGARVPEAADALAAPTGCYSTQQLRTMAAQLGGDSSWCLERRELLALLAHVQQVCAACRPLLVQRCTKQLPCRHWCAGVRGDACLPCLQPGCDPQAGPVGDGSCCCCLEPLAAAAAIALSCHAGHYVHLQCAKKRLQVGCPGPALTFAHLFCPLCGGGGDGRGHVQAATAPPHLVHHLLLADLQEPLQLRQQVVALAKARLKQSGLASAPELQPGGAFDGRPADLALSRFDFFACSRCKQPYFGGARECGGVAGAQHGQPAAFDADELVCGSCSALAAGALCPVHGAELVEYKCHYCCSVAAWFCWGTTHMCSSCHDNPGARHGNVCRGRDCPLAPIPHPKPGSACCLGCGLCRRAG